MGKKKKDKKTDKTGKKKKQLSSGKQSSVRQQGPAESAEMNQEDAVMVFKALSDENRVKILELLSKNELCTADLLREVDVVQSTMSHHMKVLMESSLVSCRKDGKRSLYSIRRDRVRQLMAYLGEWSRE